MVEYLVRTAAVLELDLNHVDHDGANVLFYCAASGRLNLLRLLLKVHLISSDQKSKLEKMGSPIFFYFDEARRTFAIS